MHWVELFSPDTPPTLDDIADYIGGEAGDVWRSLVTYMDTAYQARPKLTYSVCAGKPGWNVKFQKRGQSFGTFYPEERAFSVLLVISYKLHPLVEAIQPSLSAEAVERYKNAGDYMKIGRWMMWPITNAADLDDYKTLIAVKMLPKE